jgi:Fis family transcriptional regulator
MAIIQIKEAKNLSQHLIVVEQQGERLSDSVRRALRNYFSQLKGEGPKEVYQMVLAEIEVPLLEAVMEQTGNNQFQTAVMLGLSRGTLRTKLKNYGMLSTMKRISKKLRGQ